MKAESKLYHALMIRGLTERLMEYMEQTLGGTYEEKDEYEITFLDDGNTLAWVSGNDLTLMMRNDCAHILSLLGGWNKCF